jgi:hypothetical protein
MGDFIVSTNDGRTVLAEERDIIKLGDMQKITPEAPRKKRFGIFEAGGDLGGEPKEVKGYRVRIFSSDLGSNSNLLDGKNSAILVTDGKTGDSSTVMSNEPHLRLIIRDIFGKRVIHAIPVNYGNEGKHKMFGGNFVWSTDSRFRNDVSEQPVALHDRVEFSEGGKTPTKYKIFEGYDHFNNKPLYKVTDNEDYEGEWHTNKSDAEKELNELNNSFGEGGNIAKENNEMLHSQAKEAKHHVDELHNILTSKTHIEPWVVAKMERATTDLSDITHYLEGNNSKYENGGTIDQRGDYMLLGRLQSDCDYFLGFGNGNEGRLWAGNVKDQIAEMKSIYNRLQVKPEWITMKDINKYERQMKAKLAEKGQMSNGGGVDFGNNKVYKLRAEGLNDFLAFLQKGMYMRVKSFTIKPIGVPDVEVSFETDASLSEIKSKLREVPDSHVMLETVKPINEYTGEREEDYEEYAKGGGVGKNYYQQYGVGKSKYVVNYHDGKKTHRDGSEFYDIAIFKNKVDLNNFISKLRNEGYSEKYADGGEVGKKVFNQMQGIGKSKYVVNYHDGKKTHKDGSEFYDIAIFKNKVDLNNFIKKLTSEGYVEKYSEGGKLGSNLNPHSFTLDELNNLLRDKDIYISYFMSGWSGITPAAENKFIFTSISSLAFKQWKDKKLTISNYGQIEVDKGSENIGLAIIVYEGESEKPYTIRLYSKDNISGLKEVAKEFITKMGRGGKLTSSQKAKIEKVMHEFKEGELHSGSKTGPVVKKRDQAIAIALAEANASKKMADGGKVSKFKVGDPVFGILSYFDKIGYDLAEDVLDGNRYNGVILDIEYFADEDLETDYLIEFENDTTLFVPESEMGKKVFHQFDENEMADGGGVDEFGQGGEIKSGDVFLNTERGNLFEVRVKTDTSFDGKKEKYYVLKSIPPNPNELPQVMLVYEFERYLKYGHFKKQPKNKKMAAGGAVEINSWVREKKGNARGQVYEIDGDFVKLQDKYGNKGNTLFRISNLKLSSRPRYAEGGGVDKNIESTIITEEENARLKQFIKHPIFKNYKEIGTFSSGGGYNHTMILLANNHVVTINWESGDVQYSYYTYKSIEEYAGEPEDAEKGWDNEFNAPELIDGFPNYSDLDDKTFLDRMMAIKKAAGGKMTGWKHKK